MVSRGATDNPPPAGGRRAFPRAAVVVVLVVAVVFLVGLIRDDRRLSEAGAEATADEMFAQQLAARGIRSDARVSPPTGREVCAELQAGRTPEQVRERTATVLGPAVPRTVSDGIVDSAVLAYCPDPR